MRIAAFYDIHANLPALEAVLEEARREKVDRVLVGGDVLPGPMPRETLARLFSLDVPVDFIYGNGEIAVLDVLAGRVPAAVSEQYRPIINWSAEQLAPEYEGELKSWPKTLRLDVPFPGGVLFCHATPRDENECFTSSTPEELLVPVFANTNASLVICGHTHMQFDRMIGRTRVVNAGSVGMPFGEPGADWLLLGPEVEFRHTRYDLSEAAARIRASNYPEAEQFATRSILQPPSAVQMLDVFTQASLKALNKTTA